MSESFPPVPDWLEHLPLPAVIYAHGDDGWVVAGANRSALDWGAGTLAGVPGTPLDQAAASHRLLGSTLDQCRAGRTPADIELSVHDAARGSTGRLWVQCSQLDPFRVLAVAVDLSARRLGNSLRGFFDIASDLLCIADSGGWFHHLSTSWQETLGLKLAELMARPLPEQVPPDERETVLSMLRDLAAGKSVQGRVIRFRRADGTVVQLEWNAAPHAGLIFAAARDISARMEAEERAAAERRKAERAVRVKDEFLAHMSHQLYTPLNSIVGLGELIGRGPLEPERRDHLRKLNASAHQLLAMVNDLLDYTALATGRIALEQVEFDLREVVESAWDRHAARADAKGLWARLTFSPDLPPVLRGDARRLHQVLTHLLDNAVRHTMAGGISLDVAPGTNAGRGMVCFTVADTGCGIPPERRNLLFEPLVPPASRLTDTAGGAGLGLTLSRELVALMGGSISCDTAVDHGSRFFVRLPLDQGTKAGHGPAALPRGLRALVVDDNEINRVVAAEMLRQLGVQAMTAASGAAAIELAGRERFDCVFMDIQMPSMSGYEAALRIRALPGHEDQAIVALTAFGSEPDRAESQAAGMRGHLVKPVNLDGLERAMRACLGGADSHLAFPAPAGAPTTSAGDPVEAAASRLGGNRALARELLALFAAECHEDLARLQELAAAGKAEPVSRIAHGLKGSAGNLALDGIARLAAELEAGVRRGASPANLGALVDDLADACAALSDHLDAETTNGPASPAKNGSPVSTDDPAARLLRDLPELARLLEARNFRAAGLLGELRPLLAALPGRAAATERLAETMARLDFAQARRLLDEFLPPA